MKRDRAYYRKQRARIIANRAREMRDLGNDHMLDEPGRMAVKHPLDCGRRCMVCHGEKLLNQGAKRAREKRSWRALDASDH
jgi:hypothetical protein